MKRLIVLMPAILCACADPLQKMTSSQEDKFSPQIEKWVGRSADDLVATKGAPLNVYQMDAGERQYEYLGRSLTTRGSMTNSKDNKLQVLYNNKEVAPPVQIDPAINSGTPQAELRRKTVKPKNKKCLVLFNVGADNVIRGWTSEGDGCK